MIDTDPLMMVIIHLAIILFVFYARYKDVEIDNRRRKSGVIDEVIRGDKSMTPLYTVYGATIASFLVLIGNASGLDGHKVVLIVLDFLCVTYAFFFNSWFRNIVFFPLQKKIHID